MPQSPPDTDDPGDPGRGAYRPCVGVALFNNQGEVFVGLRADAPHAWQMPQGGIDAGETPAQAALREVVEETGARPQDIEILEVAPGPPLRYDLPPDLAARMWGGRYRGQAQTWVAARYTGADADMRLDAHLDAPPEFTAWRWVPLARIAAEIVPFKRAVYAAVARMFARHARGPGSGA
jgi:putative (di)nucleoside polyphosphate hydrolase